MSFQPRVYDLDARQPFYQPARRPKLTPRQRRRQLRDTFWSIALHPAIVILFAVTMGLVWLSNFDALIREHVVISALWSLLGFVGMIAGVVYLVVRDVCDEIVAALFLRRR